MARNTSGAQYAASKYIELPVRKDALLMPFLMEQLSGTSRNRVKDLLSGRAVTVDRKLVTRHDYPLRTGMMVRITRHKKSSELVNKYVKIIYEDKDIVVIEKAEGILSMASTQGQFCVKTILDEYFKKRHFKCTAHVVHRLDRETSGLIMYAKNRDVQKVLEEQWHELVFDRRYVAVVCGKMEKEGGTVHSWLRDTKKLITYSSPEDNGGKEATTHYHTLQTAEEYSLVELKLETGRKNQIRVHMKDLGHPVMGDNKYGNGKDYVGRLALHAYRLNFYHPVTGELMEFETPFPQKFVRLFNERKEDDNLDCTSETHS